MLKSWLKAVGPHSTNCSQAVGLYTTLTAIVLYARRLGFIVHRIPAFFKQVLAAYPQPFFTLTPKNYSFTYYAQAPTNIMKFNKGLL